MANMTLRRWLAGWALGLAALGAFAFAFSYTPGDAGWLVLVRWLVGFAGLPLAVTALLTIVGEGGRREPVSREARMAAWRAEHEAWGRIGPRARR